MLQNKKVAVVVPAYCEERLLPETLETIPEFVDRIIVVDDGSPDETFEVAKNQAASRDDVEVVRLGFNYGVGRAITAGYQRALKRGSDVVAVMAADAQMDPEDLEAVVAPVVREDADYSKGDRLAHPEVEAMPPVRRFGTRVLARLTGWVAGRDDVRDSQCGYTAISASMLRRLPLDELYPRYGYPNDLLIRLAAEDADIAQPVVRPVYGDEESGFDVAGVVGPISKILAHGAFRRVRNRVRRRIRRRLKGVLEKGGVSS